MSSPHINAIVGRRIAERRKQLGLKPADLAATLGITPRVLLNYESGMHRLGCGDLYEIAVALKLTDEIGWFFGRGRKPEA
jgi:transcriptional regulator with XRE-family HTH domain